MIVTDGVFSMDGDLAELPEICDLAEKYGALVMVDDSHATGFVGRDRPRHGRAVRLPGPRRHHHHHPGQGARRRRSAAASAGRREIIEWLRQKSRPYLFSNSLPPMICGAALEVLRILREDTGPLRRLERNQRGCARGCAQLGFDVEPGEHPIMPVHFRRYEDDALMAQAMAADLLPRASTASGSASRWCRGARRASACRPRRRHTDAHVDRCWRRSPKVGRRHGAIA